MKSSLLKTVLATQLELYSAGNLVVNNHSGPEELNLNEDLNSNAIIAKTSEESFLVELDDELFNELLNLEKQYPLTIHVIDNNTIIITPLPGNVSYNIPIVKSCRYLPAHVIFLVSDIMPFDIQLAFLEHIKCLNINADDTPLNYSTGIFNKYTRDLKDLPLDTSSMFDSGFVKLPSMFRYVSDIISGIVGRSDHFVTRLRSSIRNWNSIQLRLFPTEFYNSHNDFTVVVDGGRTLNSITTILTFPTTALDEVITLNVIITRPSDLFTLNELVFDCPFEYFVPKGVIVNYFIFDFTMKSITRSNSTRSILYVRKASSISSIKNYLDLEFKDVVKFNIYTSGKYPLVTRNVSSPKTTINDVTALSFESYDRYRTGNTLYNVNVPVYDCYPLVNVPDNYSEDSKHANFIFKRVERLPLPE